MKTKSMNITTVPQLVNALVNKPENTGYLKIMKSIDIPIEEFEKYYSWNDEHYTRNCLAKTDDFELLLVCWEKGQMSPIHDFNSSEAWIHPIHGRLAEESFQLTDNGLEQVSSLLLGTNGYSFMTDPIAIHRYINNYGARTVSLNLYAQPADTWKEYDLETGNFIEKKVSYDTMHHVETDEEVHSR